MPVLSPTRPPKDWPVYWFARLEAAVESGDHAAAADAQRQLARLGVLVRYGLPLTAESLSRERGADRG